MQYGVVCKGIFKSYGAGATYLPVLKNVDLKVETGQLLMLEGPSGCGKTTFISIVAGILKPDQGTCSVYGTELGTLSPEELCAFRARNIGFVFQSYNLLPTLTCRENVAIPLFLASVPREEALQRSGDLLGKMGLQDHLDKYPISLSGGQQQRVAIARAMIHGPKLIVCDEPTSALDGAMGQSIMTLLKEMVLESDRTLIVVTHDTRVLKFADKIARMNDGVITEIISGEKKHA